MKISNLLLMAPRKTFSFTPWSGAKTNFQYQYQPILPNSNSYQPMRQLFQTFKFSISTNHISVALKLFLLMVAKIIQGIFVDFRFLAGFNWLRPYHTVHLSKNGCLCGLPWFAQNFSSMFISAKKIGEIKMSFSQQKLTEVNSQLPFRSLGPF